jgi:hypothetical protein
MLVEAIDSPHVHMKNAQVKATFYGDSTLALVAEDVDEEGYPNVEKFSTNLSAYGHTPDIGCVFIKEDAEHTGLAKALEELGLGTIIGSVQYGPFSTRAHEFQLADDLITEAN